MSLNLAFRCFYSVLPVFSCVYMCLCFCICFMQIRQHLDSSWLGMQPLWLTLSKWDVVFVHWYSWMQLRIDSTCIWWQCVVLAVWHSGCRPLHSFGAFIKGWGAHPAPVIALGTLVWGRQAIVHCNVFVTYTIKRTCFSKIWSVCMHAWKLVCYSVTCEKASRLKRWRQIYRMYLWPN